MIAKFRGIISAHVKDCISKIMIDGKLSYFMISSSLLEISNVVKERLDQIFDEYGVIIEFFNIEAIEVPEKDYSRSLRGKEDADQPPDPGIYLAGRASGHDHGKICFQ